MNVNVRARWAASLAVAVSVGLVSGVAEAALVHHWTLDEDVTATTTAVDSVGGANGTIGSSVLSQPGVFGGAMEFFRGDADSEVEILNFDTTGLADLTLAFWMKPTGDLTGHDNVFLRVISAGDNFEAVINPAQGHLEGSLGNNLHASGGNYPDTPNALVENEWVHIALTADGNPPGTGAMQIYLNGNLVATDPTEADNLFSNVAATLKFGHRPGRPDGDRYTGLLDDIRIYDTILSRSEIRELIPEPTSVALLLLAMVGCGALRFRR